MGKLKMPLIKKRKETKGKVSFTAQDFQNFIFVRPNATELLFWPARRHTAGGGKLVGGGG